MAARMGDGFAPDLWQIASDAIVNEAIDQAGHALPRPALTLVEAAGPVERTGRLAEWDCERLYRRMADTPEGAGRARRQAAEDGQKPDLRPGGDGGGQGADTGGTGRPSGARIWPAPWRPGRGGVWAGRAGAAHGRPANAPHPVGGGLAPLAGARHAAPPGTRAPAPVARMAGRGGAGIAGNPPPCRPSSRARAGRARPRALCWGWIVRRRWPMTACACCWPRCRPLRGACRPALHLLSFDEGLHHDMALDPATARATLAALDLPQGGGTDFRPVIARAGELAPSALVILSDMDGPTGPRPRFPVIWAAPQPDPPQAPFGHVLSLAAERAAIIAASRAWAETSRASSPISCSAILRARPIFCNRARSAAVETACPRPARARRATGPGSRPVLGLHRHQRQGRDAQHLGLFDDQMQAPPLRPAPGGDLGQDAARAVRSRSSPRSASASDTSVARWPGGTRSSRASTR